MMAGLFIVIARGNLIKKLVGLGIFQTSVYLLYIAPGKLIGGTAPIMSDAFTLYSNPLPHVLILTAIVVGVATLALGPGAGGAHPRGLRLHRGRRDPGFGCGSEPSGSTMSLATHLPALQVVVPLLAAPLTVLLRRRSAAFAVALAASWSALAIAIALWLQVAATARSPMPSAAGRRRGASSTASTR